MGQLAVWPDMCATGVPAVKEKGRKKSVKRMINYFSNLENTRRL